MSLPIKTRLLIGGPARCGKTKLSERISETDKECFVLGVDALFRAVLRQGIVNKIRPTTEIVRHFLSRQRFQDAEHKIAESALDYTSLDIDTLTSPNLIMANDHPIRAYVRTIDAMAKGSGKTAWATFDLHPEFEYPKLRALIPGLKLVVMFREPREAIAATLYRQRPDHRSQHTRREFRRALLLWGISATTSLAHLQRWPNDVCLFTLPELLTNGSTLTVFGVSARPGSNDAITSDTLHFRLTTKGFLLPNGQQKPLLSSKELAEIDALLYPLANAVGLVTQKRTSRSSGGFFLNVYFKILMALAKRQPQNAATILDFCDRPLGAISRRVSLLYTAIKVLLCRLRFPKRAGRKHS